MTTNERRAAWRQYACAALANPRCPTSNDAAESAGDMLKLEDDAHFADDTTDLHAALATARAHALEQETRAANAEMALRQAQHVIRVLKEDEAPSVHVCDAAEQRAAAAKPAEGGEPRPCLDPNKMHGACDGFGGSDYYGEGGES